MRHITVQAIAISPQRVAMGLIGLLSWGSASVSGFLGWAHASAQGLICGTASLPHCGWCLSAAGFALAGLAAFRASTARAAAGPRHDRA